ncbi:E3 ubiquitin-protein ligase MARCH2 [Carex littledalei]|uniref:E3 ubiquitin-protein ligase MARCH2 n=1 Tax=Carex littledalei TaxID=544730 RepID=A0A833RTL4_9POAL|nr:E3 ubiquitin-protein ligase MARCH2 [Carex littledalei]
MEKGEEEVGLLVKDDELGMVSSSRDTCQCRICHEEEPERSTSMESPCACSGSLKFAHRSCVQRWCDEKGSTVCEICLQNFESGYKVPVPPKKVEPVHVAVTIRGSLDVPRQNYEAIGVTNVEYVECSSAPSRGASCCRSLVITLTTLLLLRHFMDVLLIRADQDQYASSLLIMFLLRATGILLPFYFVLRLISAIQHGQRQYKLEQIQLRRGEEIDRFTSDEENPSHYTIQILS